MLPVYVSMEIFFFLKYRLHYFLWTVVIFRVEKKLDTCVEWISLGQHCQRVTWCMSGRWGWKMGVKDEVTKTIPIHWAFIEHPTYTCGPVPNCGDTGSTFQDFARIRMTYPDIDTSIWMLMVRIFWKQGRCPLVLTWHLPEPVDEPSCSPRDKAILQSISVPGLGPVALVA
jgi:hypothetical protein